MTCQAGSKLPDFDLTSRKVKDGKLTNIEIVTRTRHGIGKADGIRIIVGRSTIIPHCGDYAVTYLVRPLLIAFRDNATDDGTVAVNNQTVNVDVQTIGLTAELIMILSLDRTISVHERYQREVCVTALRFAKSRTGVRTSNGYPMGDGALFFQVGLSEGLLGFVCRNK